MQPLAAVILLISCATALAGSTAAGPADAAEPGSAPADLVRVAVVVTDRTGKPVTGLQAGDFDLLIDGARQPVDAVERVAPDPARSRTFAFLLDEFHVAPADSAAVREALGRFVNRHVRPTDRVVAVKPLDSLHAIAPGSDLDALRNAVATFEGRKGDFTPRSAFEREYMAQAPAAAAAARAQIVTSALRATAASLSTTDTGRTAIVLVSDGFGRAPAARDLPASLEAALRVANRADAPVYAFAPGLSVPAPGEEAGREFSALRALASGTGGALVTGVTRLDAGLAQMVRDMDTYYVLTSRTAHGSDGRFHSLKVAARADGLLVRARTGYVASRPAPQPEARRPAAAPRVIRSSALIRSWSGFFPTGADRGLVALTWEPAIPRAASPGRPRPATVIVNASSAEGELLFDAAVAPAHRPAGEVPNVALFDAPRGVVRIDLKILDEEGVVIDTEARDLTMPGVRADVPTIYPPAVLRTRSAREFRHALAKVDAPPAASRDFRRTDRLILRVPAVGAAGEPARISAVLLNRRRQTMRTLPQLPEAGPGGAAQFDLPLAALAPGEYSVRITATASGGSVSEYVVFRVQG